MIKSIQGIILAILLNSFSFGQGNSSASILHKLEKLQVLGSVLYVAAHPDDENTGMITYFSNERKMKTTYLSLTRGDGGQNLIGPEKFQWMGLIRTQELLEARKIDGGEQAFTRAYDFGYSKTPDETLRIWNEDSILSDVVWVIRKLKPDIVVTRFSPDMGRRTHGHHTSSAILARKAFDLAGKKDAYPDQLKHVDPWQPERIFFNTSWWFYGSRDFDKTGLIEIETGQFNPLLGKSYGEIAAESRSMHKSQGFGVISERGSDMEYLKPLAGSPSPKDPLQEINTGWGRVAAEAIGQSIEKLILDFDSRDPSKSVGGLLKVKGMISNIQDEFWKKQKLFEIDQIIIDCLGIYAEARSSNAELVPGENFALSLTTIQRQGSQITLKKIESTNIQYSWSLGKVLDLNLNFEVKDTIPLPMGYDFTVPYWLENPLRKGRFVVPDQTLIGKPQNDFEVPFRFTYEFEDQEFSVTVPAIYKWRDRVNGEMKKEVVVVPPIVASFSDKNILFPNQKPKNVQVIVKGYLPGSKEQVVKLDLPKGWSSEPEFSKISLQPGEEKRIDFLVSSPKKEGVALVGILAGSESDPYRLCQVQIEHDHIKPLTAIVPNDISFVRKDIQNTASVVGYVDGAGDEIPQALIQLGSEVKYLEEEDFFNGGLKDLDAIVFGVRAYNTAKWLPNVKENILKFVENGGNVVVQYNVSYGLVTEDIGPYPLKISRDRVTDESAEVKILDPSNPVFNAPNKIGAEEFQGWVQERGLYFPNEWDEKYTPLIACHDPGEDDLSGAILTTSYGKGTFTYTGISWFRQLPAGVAGAYKIFANLISAKNGS